MRCALLALGVALASSALAQPSPRAAFNQRALLADLPLFWRADADRDGHMDDDEVALLWYADAAKWRQASGALSDHAHAALAQLDAPSAPPALGDVEARRRAKVAEALSASHRVLVSTDMRHAPARERQMMRHLLEAAAVIERLHARQRGVLGMEARIPADDPASRALLRRNQGPWCELPHLERDPLCTALWPKPERIFDLYPPSLQANPDFCDTLAKEVNHEELLDPFHVIEMDERGVLVPTFYHERYADEMSLVSAALYRALSALGDEEPALRAYLKAAASAFLDDRWFEADEAWADMNATNSRYYLRVGPDETYFEPCSAKAGFHLTLARINPGSLAWQRALDPLKQEMEAAWAALAGAPYAARPVSFHLPDFIDIVLNAGEARGAFGATIGQSLPNWGPVTNEGRGRTVAMVNLYTDADSQARQRRRASSALCPSAMNHFHGDPSFGIMSTILHEASHNLGPSAEYAVAGKTAKAIFGGPLAQTLEELKAQMGSLYFARMLAKRGVITRRQAEVAHVMDLVWSLGHVSNGLYTAEGRPKHYAQLSAIILGRMLDVGALAWRPTQIASNGRDQGCFEVDVARLGAAGEALTREVLQIKGQGLRAQAEALKARYVDGEGPLKALRPTIEARWRREKKVTFEYEVRL